MADSDSQDKKLPASARKLAKARAEGHVPRSRDLGHLAAVLAGGSLVVGFMPTAVGWIREMLTQSLRFDLQTLSSPAMMTERLWALALKALLLVLPLACVVAVVGVVSSLALGGWVWSLKPLQPSLDKINPLAGFTKLFSKKQLGETLKASGLALLLGTVGAFYLRSHFDTFTAMLQVPLPAALSQVGDTLLGGLMLLLLLLGVFALIDVPLQRHMFLSGQKMSHQEAKQEHKESEGNGEVKGRMRARMREMSRRRMLAAVPQADLVVMNPTHYAVALAYDEKRMGAPRVVAKGADLLAMRIRDTAREHKVPVLQSPVLARALYAHAELDREIPAALFAAVAQVLAYVYQLRAALAGHAPPPGDLPDLPVPPELDPHHGRPAAA